jgi:thioredoxin 1
LAPAEIRKNPFEAAGDGIETIEQRAVRRREVTGKLPDVTDGTFQSEVLEAERPVLVDFWAPWCGPCRVVHPILEEMAAERDDFHIVSINVDENQQTAARFDVLSIPTLILFRDGAEAKRVIGAMPKRRLEAELEPALTT